MALRVRRLIFALTAVTTLIFVNLSHASLVTWEVDSAQSFARLAIPDQTILLDDTSAMLRLRAANNSAWSDSTGRRAFLGGTIATDLQSNSIQFLGGSHSLFALESGSYRPNPAGWDPNAINADNPDGQFTGGVAPAAFAARAIATVSLVAPDLAYLAFRDVFFDVNSDSIPMGSTPGGFVFAGGTNTFGIQSAAVDVDGIDTPIVGQPVPDLLHSPLSDLNGLNTVGGVIELVTPFGTKLTFNVNVPIAIDIDGVPLNATISGQIVAYWIPEPSSLLLAGFGACGLCCIGRRRLFRHKDKDRT